MCFGLLHCFDSVDFSGAGVISTTPTPRPGGTGTTLHLALILCDMGGPTRSLRFCQHSSRGHWGMPTSPLLYFGLLLDRQLHLGSDKCGLSTGRHTRTVAVGPSPIQASSPRFGVLWVWLWWIQFQFFLTFLRDVRRHHHIVFCHVSAT